VVFFGTKTEDKNKGTRMLFGTRIKKRNLRKRKWENGLKSQKEEVAEK
jgi:hypothetical protein